MARSALRERLSYLRRETERGGVGASTRAVSDDEHDLYKIIYRHRNSNLHGGGHVVHVGLAALLMATLIAFDDVQDHYEQYRSYALEVSTSSPLNPGEEWPHYVYYPVQFFGDQQPRNVHRWTETRRWQVGDQPSSDLPHSTGEN